eukprot:Platyproteum_vivax@DN10647_c0_g1_i1.p2
MVEKKKDMAQKMAQIMKGKETEMMKECGVVSGNPMSKKAELRSQLGTAKNVTKGNLRSPSAAGTKTTFGRATAGKNPNVSLSPTDRDRPYNSNFNMKTNRSKMMKK